MSLKVVELDCKTVGFFLKISKEFGKAWRKSLTRAKRASLTRPPQSRSLFSALFQTFCLTARAYLNKQKIRIVLQSIVELKCSFYFTTVRRPLSQNRSSKQVRLEAVF